MLIETSQMQRLIIALGHPTYGLSVVLFSLLLSSGVGSYLTSGALASEESSADEDDRARHRARRIRDHHSDRCQLEPAADDAAQDPCGCPPAVSCRLDDGNGVPFRDADGVGTSCGLDALAVGTEWSRLRAGVGPRRLYRADVVDFDSVLGGMALLRCRAWCVRRGCARQSSRSQFRELS